MNPVRLLARPMLAAHFVLRGAKALREPEPLVPKAKPLLDRVSPAIQKAVPQLPDDPATLVRIQGAVTTAAGLGLATGKLPRLSALVLAASLVPTTLSENAFWQATDPVERLHQRQHFLQDVGLAGGLLLAGVDTAGKPGVAWRARRATLDAKRGARTAQREAVLASRLARADARRRTKGLVR